MLILRLEGLKSWFLLFSVGSTTANRAAAMRVLSVANDIIKTLVPLASRKDNILIRLVAELLGLFCTMGKLTVLLQSLT